MLRTEKGRIGSVLRSNDLSGDNGRVFEAYFDLFFRQFRIKATDNPQLGTENLHLARKNLRIFLQYGKSGAAYDRLVARALEECMKIAPGPDYHPAARINAMLVLGSLNQQEPNGKPVGAAFRPLLGVVKIDRKRFPDELKIAAMIGLERWAQEGAVPADKKGELAAEMLKLFEEETPPSGRTSQGHSWMRRSAAKVLAALGDPGPDNRVVAAFQTVIADSQARPAMRCEIAECLGKIKFPQGAKVDYELLANLLGHQTVEICLREIDDARSTARTPSRRMLAYALYSALHALEGTDGRSGLVAAAAGTNAQEFVKTVRDKVEDAYGAAADEDLNLEESVNPLIDELRGLLPPKPAPKAEVATEKETLPAEPAKQPEAAAAAGAASAGGT